MTNVACIRLAPLCRRAPTIIIVNEQGEELGSSKANSHSLWVLSRRLVRMLLKHEVGAGGVSGCLMLCFAWC